MKYFITSQELLAAYQQSEIKNEFLRRMLARHLGQILNGDETKMLETYSKLQNEVYSEIVSEIKEQELDAARNKLDEIFEKS